MPIAKQIHAFLEVSEVFLRQSGNGPFNDGLSSLEGVGGACDARTLMACVLLNRKTSANGGNGGGAVPARLADGA
ncbi:hypothetical protein PQR46_10280 [Paraburkholderia sediminicola]|uniref:Uncharacterized protein n=1 Tax=Paraburkholderia metrosideri TaxID=580937 RepID=A0ABW9DX27_9BURK